MPRNPEEELTSTLALIDAEHAALKLEVAQRMEKLTALHRRADELRHQLGIKPPGNNEPGPLQLLR